MSNNFIIPPSPVNAQCQLTFHEYNIYDSITWTQSGNLAFDQPSGNFTVLPYAVNTGLYFFDATTKTYSVVNFNPSPNSVGNMRYDQATNTITLV